MDIGLRRCARLYPHDGDRGGFFLAAFVKKTFSLTTPRLRLRPFVAADAARLPALCGDLEVSRTCMRVPHPYGITEARFFLDKVCDGGAGPSSTQGSTLRDRIIQMKRGARLSLTLAVVKRDGDELIGCVSLDRDSFNETPRIGYWLGRAFWRRGYATEAARAIIAHGFDVLQLERVDGTHFLENPASGAVLRKLGFVAVDEPSPPQACAARGGVALPTATLRLARPQSRPAADAHPLRLIDEDAWGGWCWSWTSAPGTRVRDGVICEVGAARAARARGYSIELRPSSSAASWPRAWLVEGAGVKIVEKRGGGEAARQLGSRLVRRPADLRRRRRVAAARGARRETRRRRRRDGVARAVERWTHSSARPARRNDGDESRHGGRAPRRVLDTLWRGAADAVTVMVRGDDLERLRRGLPADRPFLPYAARRGRLVATIAVVCVERCADVERAP